MDEFIHLPLPRTQMVRPRKLWESFRRLWKKQSGGFEEKIVFHRCVSGLSSVLRQTHARILLPCCMFGYGIVVKSRIGGGNW